LTNISNKKIVDFAIENIEIFEDPNDSQFATLKIDAFASGDNRHNLYVSEETLRRTASTILEKPLVWLYNKSTDDASSHSELEQICGFIPNYSELTFSDTQDGRVMLQCTGRIWTRYSGKLMEIFERDKNKAVSVELEVLEESENEKLGIPEILDFVYRCITILGQTVTPAIPGAKADLLAFAAKEKEDYEEALQLEFSNRYSSIDFTIPTEIKNNAQKGLSLYSELGVGGNSVSLSNARHLIKNSIVSIDKVKSIHKYLQAHKRNLNNKKSGEYVGFMLHGGSHAIEWSKNMVNAIKEIDEKNLSYFEKPKIIGFPYKSITDAPPSIQKLDGVSLTAEQASEIAAQADKIGGDYAWPTAIKSWKSRHHIEKGHWVKNKTEKASEEVSEDDFAKGDWGQGKELKVDKSKDKVSDASWGDIDKTLLMHKVLDASNYKSLVHDVYLIVESGWEDHPSSSLKYPVMQLIGDTFVYNKGGLVNALVRAKGQGENALASKIESIRKKLGLNQSEEEEMSMNEFEKDNVEKPKDEEETPEEEKQETPEEEKKEGEEKMSKSKDEEKMSTDEEKPEDEKSEDMAAKDEKSDEPETEKMSNDANLDVAAALAMLEDDTEEYKKLVAEHKSADGVVNYAVLCNAMYKKMCKMSEAAQKDRDAYMELAEYKKGQQEKQFAHEVESTLADVMDVMPKAEIANAREDSKNYDLKTVDAWKNKVKATAFSFTKEKKNDDGITRIAMTTGWLPDSKDEKNDGLWLS
jgi:hypothetical protein